VTAKVTFGDDHSTGSDTAWGWITAHTWPGWSLDVITVEQPPSRTDLSPLGYDALHEWSPPDARTAPATCAFDAVHHLTAHHDPRVILGTLLDSKLLVVGPRGKGLLKALHIGSTTEWLLQCPNTPLLIARSDEPTRNIVLCVDGSPHAQAAVDILCELPWIGSTEIQVVAVVESENDIRAAAQAAAKQLETTGAQVTVRIVLPDPLTITRNPRVDIFNILDADQPQLVVCGTRGLTGIPRLRLGSVASAIAHYAKCSVLLARDRSEDDGTS
jgi:nucleotide-binding universal stress UspA family protein